MQITLSVYVMNLHLAFEYPPQSAHSTDMHNTAAPLSHIDKASFPYDYILRDVYPPEGAALTICHSFWHDHMRHCNLAFSSLAFLGNADIRLFVGACADNSLTGSPQEGITALPFISYINLDGNRFSGPLPYDLFFSQSLSQLSMVSSPFLLARQAFFRGLHTPYHA